HRVLPRRLRLQRPLREAPAGSAEGERSRGRAPRVGLGARHWREATFTLAPNTVVIAEGCFLFAGRRERELDLSVWLDLPLEQVVGRALARPRDVERMGGPDGVRERYAARYLPGQRLHLERDDPKGPADNVLQV